ncbi:kinesin family protein [Coccidioides immitis H538.4]|uniref:Kinesin family protein n=2 Tax=Coccidioides immitis TaxID=5501 RepID=A0A0J8U6M7_COCIT|nr:kinesin family protein [Coccidioides immitis RMSCC 2394]KMU82658.1 kinesin family protein [Coccidioides immitis H538.4]
MVLNGCRECYVREGPDGRVHVRGETEVLEGGKIRVRPVVVRDCWSFEDLRRELQVGLKLRAIGLSTVHDQSSRTHAVVELEVVTKSLLDARDAIIDRESKFVPVAKRATDIYLEEDANAYIKTPEGKYVPNPDRPPNQERIDAAEKEKERRKPTHAMYSHLMTRDAIFVDLAGSEYYHEKATPSTFATKMTPQERQEGRQINTDLLALKEVIRARALNQARIPFRSLPTDNGAPRALLGFHGHVNGLPRLRLHAILYYSPTYIVSGVYSAVLSWADNEGTSYLKLQKESGLLPGSSCYDVQYSTSSRTTELLPPKGLEIDHGALLISTALDHLCRTSGMTLEMARLIIGIPCLNCLPDLDVETFWCVTLPGRIACQKCHDGKRKCEEVSLTPDVEHALILRGYIFYASRLGFPTRWQKDELAMLIAKIMRPQLSPSPGTEAARVAAEPLIPCLLDLNPAT